MTENAENTGNATTEATAPVVEKPAKVEQNGVTRPKEGTKTGKVWEFADELSAAINAPAKRADVLAKANAAGINPATTTTQYGRWRKFHGLGKEVAEAAPATTETTEATESTPEAGTAAE